jgi:hypothetical protein
VAELRHVTTKYVFDVEHLPALRDAKRRKFSPVDAIVTHRSGKGFREVRVHGFKTGPAGWSTSVIWGITDGRIVPNSAGLPPQWLQGLVAQAITQHNSIPAGPATDEQALAELLAAVERITGVETDSYMRLVDACRQVAARERREMGL